MYSYHTFFILHTDLHPHRVVWVVSWCVNIQQFGSLGPYFSMQSLHKVLFTQAIMDQCYWGNFTLEGWSCFIQALKGFKQMGFLFIFWLLTDDGICIRKQSTVFSSYKKEVISMRVQLLGHMQAWSCYLEEKYSVCMYEIYGGKRTHAKSHQKTTNKINHHQPSFNLILHTFLDIWSVGFHPLPCFGDKTTYFYITIKIWNYLHFSMWRGIFIELNTTKTPYVNFKKLQIKKKKKSLNRYLVIIYSWTYVQSKNEL